MTAHTDVGAYSMGLLEEEDRREFEDHLAGCPACTAELAELSPMKGLLRGVEPARTADSGGGDSGESGLTDLVRRRVAQERRRRRWQVAVGTAAAAVLIGGSIGAGIALAPRPGGR